MSSWQRGQLPPHAQRNNGVAPQIGMDECLRLRLARGGRASFEISTLGAVREAVVFTVVSSLKPWGSRRLTGRQRKPSVLAQYIMPAS